MAWLASEAGFAVAQAAAFSFSGQNTVSRAYCRKRPKDVNRPFRQLFLLQEFIVIHILNFFTLKHFSGLLSFINSPTMTGIRNGLVCTMPLVVAGSLALLINNFPVPAYQNIMLDLFGGAWKSFGGKLWAATFGAISLTVTFSIANNYKSTKSKSSTTFNNFCYSTNINKFFF